MVGGVLVERNVGEAKVALQNKVDKELTTTID